jgi:DNA-binding NtrC family response regulator
VTTLLDFSRLRAGTPLRRQEGSSIDEAIETAVEEERSDARARRIDVVLEREGEAPAAAFDPPMVERAVANLIRNAVSVSERRDGEVERRLIDRDGTVTAHVRVSDQGPGVPSDVRDTIFRPFVTRAVEHSPKSVGVGLGLSLAREVALAHGGDLRARRERHLGRLVRPHPPPRQGLTAALVASGTSHPTTNVAMSLPANEPLGHVLVVDDEEDLCELLAMRLEHHGFRASIETNVAGAIEVMEREIVDAMIVDLRLDGESGLDLLDAVQQRSLDLPVIILTAHGSVESAVEAMARGAYGFLTKPFHDHELLEKVRHGVERVRLRREVAGPAPHRGERRAVIACSARASASKRLGSASRASRPSDATVLLLGESGTGKELAARTLHALSPGGRALRRHQLRRADRGAPRERALRPRQRGAFTGRGRDKDGAFAAAKAARSSSTRSATRRSVQVKLLRVLEEREMLPVAPRGRCPSTFGWWRRRTAISAQEVAAGRFREDLLYRLHVVPVVMPPLRERKEDLPLLAELFLSRAGVAPRPEHAAPLERGARGAALPQLAGQRARARERDGGRLAPRGQWRAEAAARAGRPGESAQRAPRARPSRLARRPPSARSSTAPSCLRSARRASASTAPIWRSS